jgi:hypothetical protein
MRKGLSTLSLAKQTQNAAAVLENPLSVYLGSVYYITLWAG